MTSPAKQLTSLLICLIAIFAASCIDIGSSETTQTNTAQDSGVTDTTSNAPRDANTPPDGAVDAHSPQPDGQTLSDAEDEDADDAQAQPDADTGEDSTPTGDCTPDDTSACAAPDGAVVSGCVMGNCSFDCKAGMVDLNGDLAQPSSDGCEYACVPSNEGVELCDGEDNDCDGEVDEGFANLGASCTVGDGYCQSTGEWVCASDGSQVECNALMGNAPRSERCNGIDDDCDGVVDNNMLPGFYPDLDGDGFGDADANAGACDFINSVTVTNDGDCDDTNAEVHPGATVRCGMAHPLSGPIDFNCNGKVLCEENACDGALCLTSGGGDGTCSSNVCVQRGECTVDSDCSGRDYCACLDPGPSVCCPDGMLCPCMISVEEPVRD